MATYYIVENNQQAGPFTFEQLAARGITPETNVWTEGMTNWTPASQVSELQTLFAKPAPQPAPQPEPQASADWSSESSYSSESREFRPPLKDWKTESIILTVLSVVCCCCQVLPIAGLPFGILGIVNGNKVKSLEATDYAAAKEASDAAGKWVKIGAIVFAAVTIFSIILSIILRLTGVMDELTRSMM